MPRAVLAALRPAGAPETVRPLFPDESAPGAPLPWERTYRLDGLFNAFFRAGLAALEPGLARLLELPPAAAHAFAREALVPLSHMLLERLLRAEPVLRGGDWSVAKAPPYAFPPRMEVLRDKATSSPAFNQLLLERLAPAWGVPVAEYAVPADAPAPAKGFVNRNFDPSTTAQKLRRVALIAGRRLLRKKGPVPTLSMAYSSMALKNAGFFGSLLENVQGRAALSDGARDARLREGLAALLPALEAPLAAFLKDAGSAVPAPRALASLSAFLVDAWPTSLLEAAKANHDAAAAALAPFGRRPLLIGERGDLESITFIAAARASGREVICLQHGGHGGYLADLSSNLEMEQSHCDRYISWGWTRMLDYPPPPPGLKVVDLPNPFLSERARKWRAQLDPAAEKRWDFLLLSNGVHPFPRAPGGAAQSNSDFLAAFSEMLVDLARRARERGVSILHKPRDPSAASMLARTLERMAAEGGPLYTCTDRQDKGMTQELLDACRVVLWDQAGMGFQECVASGIPSMCYWNRLYNREDAAAEPLFRRLEAAGVVHRAPDTLFAALEEVRRVGGAAWLKEPQRAAALAEFARDYCRASGDWAADWVSFLESLPE